MSESKSSSYDVCVVGGAGHVGVPLALVLAESGLRTLILDINKAAMEMMAAGQLPFLSSARPGKCARIRTAKRR